MTIRASENKSSQNITSNVNPADAIGKRNNSETIQIKGFDNEGRMSKLGELGFRSELIKQRLLLAQRPETVGTLKLKEDLGKPVSIDFNQDFRGKKINRVKESDVAAIFAEKLAERAGLTEPLRTEFLNEMRRTEIRHGDKSHTKLQFEQHKKDGSMEIDVNEETVGRLREYQVKQSELNVKNEQRADELINKYTEKESWSWDEDGGWFDGKRDYPLDEAGLGKELANENAEVIGRVLEKLPNPEDAGQVSQSLMNTIGDEQLVNLAVTKNGKAVLEKIKAQVPAQAERINQAKETAEKRPISQPKPPRELTDAQIPTGGKPEIRWELPEYGDGFVVYNRNDSGAFIKDKNLITDPNSESPYPNKKVFDQIGTKETINNIQDIAREWDKTYSDNPLEIGDLSLPGGVDTSDHDGHQNGKIVDIRPIRTDDKWGEWGYKKGGLTFNSKNYDLGKTKDLVRLILKKHPNAKIIFNDKKIYDNPEFKGKIGHDPLYKIGTQDAVHDNHLHVEFP